MGSLAFRIGLLVGIMVLLGLVSASPASAYTVSTHWDFNKNNVDAEAYHCSGSQCSSVASQFFSGSTGSSYDLSINYNVGGSCSSGTHYDAFYFYKQCYIPMEGYVWSTCDFSYNADIDFYKRADCKAQILSLSMPSAGQPGQAVQITANVKSHLVKGLSPPDYVPPARKDEYYSGNVLVSVNVKNSGGSVVHTESKTVSIYKDTSKDVVFSWTPSEGGDYSVEIATDVNDCKCSSSDKQTNTKAITIEPQPPQNTPPVIEGIPDQTINVGQSISQIDLYPYASDSQDTDSALSFSIQSESNTGAIDCYISGNRYVQCGQAQATGYSDITVKVTDTGGLSDTDTFRINVQSQPQENTPPVIGGLPDYTISVGETISQIDLYQYASDSQDPDTALSFSVQSESDTSVIDCYISGNRYVQCGQTQEAGYSDITVKVTDTGGLSDTDAFRITVQAAPPANTPPAISGIPDYTIRVGETISQIDLYNYASDAQDPDTELDFSIDSESDTSVIDCYITGNRYLGCQASQRTGHSDITVRVTDSGGLYDTDGFRITVQSIPPANSPPVIENLPDLSLQLGQTISLLDLYQHAYDSQDLDSELDFSIDSESDTGVIDCYITGNRYLGCGQAQEAGSSNIILRVTDTGGLYDTDGMKITVQGQPQPPEEEHNPVINSVTITPSHPEDSHELVCTAEVSDQDGNLNRVEFRWFVDGGLEKTRTIYVSGSSAEAQDTLGSGSSGTGEEVRCEASVFDSQGNQDSDYDTVEIERQDCGVDVYSLEIIENEKIRFRLRNTGAAQEEISWKTYVDGSIVDEREYILDSGEWELVDKHYDFDHGEYLVKAKATADCGDTDSESLLHEVEEDEDGEDRPSMDSVEITPSDPEENDDLTCRVEVSDDDEDLEKVRFRWFIEGDLEETRTEYVSGHSDSAEDTLNSGFSDGDEVECEATVYDEEGSSDTDSDEVTIGEEDGECGVDVSNLEIVDNSEVRFKIRNTGEHEEDITWRFFVEFEEIEERTITLDEDEWETIEEGFHFGTGDYYVKVKVTADCGETDWDSVFYEGGGACQAKYLDEYRCNGVWRQRKYQNSDCSIVWLNLETCSQGCSGGFCGGAGQCGVSVQRFEYQTNVREGSQIPILAEARNTGGAIESITLSLYVDGTLKESYPSNVNTGSTLTRNFYYYPALGTHQLLLKAEASCGSSDSRTATIYATREGQLPEPGPELPTAVSIYPSSVDTGLCESKFITIDIHSSKDQVFTVQTSGIPSEWVSYQSQTIVKKGDRKLFIFVGPKEEGTRTLSIKVRAEGDGKDYFQDVSVYTSGACQVGSAQKGDWITGLASTFGSPWSWLFILILVFGIVLVVAVLVLRPDTEYYETDYPYLAKERKR